MERDSGEKESEGKTDNAVDKDTDRKKKRAEEKVSEMLESMRFLSIPMDFIYFLIPTTECKTWSYSINRYANLGGHVSVSGWTCLALVAVGPYSLDF